MTRSPTKHRHIVIKRGTWSSEGVRLLRGDPETIGSTIEIERAHDYPTRETLRVYGLAGTPEAPVFLCECV